MITTDEAFQKMRALCVAWVLHTQSEADWADGKKVETDRRTVGQAPKTSTNQVNNQEKTVMRRKRGCSAWGPWISRKRGVGGGSKNKDTNLAPPILKSHTLGYEKTEAPSERTSKKDIPGEGPGSKQREGRDG